MSASAFGLLILAAFFVYVGWRRSFIDESSSSTTEIAASIFTVIGSGEYIYAIILFLAYGFVAPTFLLGLAVSFFLLRKYVNNIRTNTRRSIEIDGYKVSSTPDYLFSVHGSFSSRVSTVITSVSFLVIMWSQFALGGVLIEASTGIEYEWSVVLIATTVGLYLSFGGLKALLHTDIWQGLLMWLGLIVVLVTIYLIDPAAHLAESFSSLGALSVASARSVLLEPTLFTVFVATIAAAFAGPDIWQRISLSQSDKSARSSLNYAGIAMLLFILPLALLAIDIFGTLGKHGVNEVLEGNLEPIEAYLQSVASAGAWPSIVMSLFSIGLLSAWLSTADTAGIVVSAAVLSEQERVDKYVRFFNPENKRDWGLPLSRIVAVAFVLVGCVFAILRKDWITEDFQGVIALLSAQGIPVLLSLKGYGSDKTVSAALVLGAAIAIVLGYITPQYNRGYMVLLPLLPGIIVLFGGKSKITPTGRR